LALPLLYYVYILITITLLKSVSLPELLSPGREIFRSIELVPFNQIAGYLSGSLPVSSTVLVYNVFGNIVLFVPAGVYAALFGRSKGLVVNMLYIFLISLSIELIQLVFGLGVCDIDDILLNCLGGLTGILLYRLLQKLYKDEGNARFAIAMLSMLVALPVGVIEILLAVHN